MSKYEHEKVLRHWDNEEVESMYDKHLLRAEIDLIARRIPEGSKILDAGCGEGEGTAVYASIPGTIVDAADFSATRLRKAGDRLGGLSNITLKQVDFTSDYDLGSDYDVVVCQRFLINITDWDLQRRVLEGLLSVLKDSGRIHLLEGYEEGVASLNAFRGALDLPPIPVQWHNLFLNEAKLLAFMSEKGFELLDEDGLGAYFLLTRGVRPALQTDLAWDTDFNKNASSNVIAKLLSFGSRFSRLKLWTFARKTGA